MSSLKVQQALCCEKFYSGSAGWRLGRWMGGAAGTQTAGLKVCHGGGGRGGVAVDLR